MRELNVLGYQEKDEVATVFLKSPINVDLIADLRSICEHLEDESSCTVVVFRGGERNFCGEIDLKEFNLGKPLDIHGFHRWEKVLNLIERLDRFTIAAIQGRCVGPGLHLALVCDQRIVSQEVELGVDEIRKGFLPGMATFRLSKYVGLGRAKSMVLTGKTLNAGEALAWGLVDFVENTADFETAVADLAKLCRPVSTVSLQLARRLLNESFGIQFEEFIGNFLAAQHRAITSETFTRLLKKAHLE